MKKHTRLFWILAAGQFCIVLSLLFWKFYIVASNDIAHPSHADAYFVYTWSFQTMVFCIFYLLPTLVVMVGLITLEWFIARLFFGKRKTDENLSA